MIPRRIEGAGDAKTAMDPNVLKPKALDRGVRKAIGLPETPFESASSDIDRATQQAGPSKQSTRKVVSPLLGKEDDTADQKKDAPYSPQSDDLQTMVPPGTTGSKRAAFSTESYLGQRTLAYMQEARTTSTPVDASPTVTTMPARRRRKNDDEPAKVGYDERGIVTIG
jgi:hypothetical protein